MSDRSRLEHFLPPGRPITHLSRLFDSRVLMECAHETYEHASRALTDCLVAQLGHQLPVPGYRLTCKIRYQALSQTGWFKLSLGGIIQVREHPSLSSVDGKSDSKIGNSPLFYNQTATLAPTFSSAVPSLTSSTTLNPVSRVKLNT